MRRAYHSIRDVLHPTPSTIRLHDLQAADGLTEEKSQSTEVSMALQPYVVGLRFFFGTSRIASRNISNGIR
jgi:hypothetical protein